MSGQNNEAALNRWRGISFSCILAFLCALAISHVVDQLKGEPFFKIVWASLMWWLVFVVTSGLVIDAKLFDPIRRLLQFSMLPAITLIIVWVLIPLFSVINRSDSSDMPRIIVFAVIAGMGAVIAIPICSLARDVLLSTVPSNLTTWADTIQKVVIAIGTVGTAIRAFIT